MLSKYPIQKSIRQANCRWNKKDLNAIKLAGKRREKKKATAFFYREDEKSNIV
jgi:hypothetical protein